MITKSQAQISSQRLLKEAASLEPTTLISLFEIDYNDIAESFDLSIKGDGIFRFHNQVHLTNSSLWYDSTHAGTTKEYIAAPITAEGFELTSQGTLPTPKLAISVNTDGISTLATLKATIRNLDDLIGAKVTRIRTFLSCLPGENFEGGTNPYGDEDAYAEFPRDVYYIDRKSNENSQIIEYEMASILDVEGIQLPSRLVITNRCPWFYRGDGCFYEYAAQRNSKEHGFNSLPELAPPVANDRDELITDILSISANFILFPDGDKKWKQTTQYNVGHACYIEKKSIKYYYVAKRPNQGFQPPNDTYWISDRCSKNVDGCKLRFGINCQSTNLTPFIKGVLPFGGFPGVGKAR